jgi:hypothetical protein
LLCKKGVSDTERPVAERNSPIDRQWICLQRNRGLPNPSIFLFPSVPVQTRSTNSGELALSGNPETTTTQRLQCQGELFASRSTIRALLALSGSCSFCHFCQRQILSFALVTLARMCARVIRVAAKRESLQSLPETPQARDASRLCSFPRRCRHVWQLVHRCAQRCLVECRVMLRDCFRLVSRERHCHGLTCARCLEDAHK